MNSIIFLATGDEAGRQQDAAGGENNGSPPSEGHSQSDYQQPLSVASDQLSTYNLSMLRLATPS